LQVIPVFQEEHENYLNKACDVIYEHRHDMEKLVNLKPLDAFFGPRETVDDPDCVPRRCYIELLFDLAKEIAVDQYSYAIDDQRPSYMKPFLVPNRQWLVPRSAGDLKSVIRTKSLQYLGFRPYKNRDRSIVQWMKKKKDIVDQILVRELQTEEKSWTDYEEEETIIKHKLTNSVFQMLVTEFTAEFKVLLVRRKTLLRRRVKVRKRFLSMVFRSNENVFSLLH
jgi:hypothetical protein